MKIMRIKKKKRNDECIPLTYKLKFILIKINIQGTEIKFNVLSCYGSSYDSELNFLRTLLILLIIIVHNFSNFLRINIT